jgi:hypothetical protein
MTPVKREPRPRFTGVIAFSTAPRIRRVLSAIRGCVGTDSLVMLSGAKHLVVRFRSAEMLRFAQHDTTSAIAMSYPFV